MIDTLLRVRAPGRNRLIRTAGLFIAWCVHDAEELVAFRPAKPGSVVDRFAGAGFSSMAVAIGIVGVVMAVAAYLGVRTGGRSLLFQIGALGFGVHGAVHIAEAILTRGYVPGVVTAVVVVVPYGVVTVRWLLAAGLADRARLARAALAGAALFVPTVLTAHLVANAVT